MNEHQCDVGRGGTPAIERPRITEVEQHGIATIPPSHRHSRPLDPFRIQFGGVNTFATSILGTFPVLLGLSLWEAVAAADAHRVSEHRVRARATSTGSRQEDD